MEIKELNRKIMEAIVAADIEVVRQMLEKGANPDGYVFLTDLYPHSVLMPLHLVVRRIVDLSQENKITESELESYGEITRLLLRHGADARSGFRYAKLAYFYQEEGTGLFWEIYHQLANSKNVNYSELLMDAVQ
jgi:hypothetical protein